MVDRWRATIVLGVDETAYPDMAISQKGDYVRYSDHERLRTQAHVKIEQLRVDYERLRDFIKDLAGSDCDNYCKHLSPQPCGECWSCRAREALRPTPQKGE